jgi:hypothetical protein
MRKRRVFISFPEQHGSDSNLLASQKVLDGLNIRFNIKIYSNVGIPAEAYISVYNLNREDMQFLTTSAATWMAQQSLMQLYAGYDNNVKCLFSGQIMDAPPEGFPDLALNIKGISGSNWMSQQIDIQKSNLKMIDLIDYTSSVTGYPVNIPQYVRNGNEILNKKLENFSYSGSVWNLLDKIQDMCGGFEVSEKSVILSTYNDNIYVWTPSSTQQGKTLLITEKTGMIGVPHPTGTGVDITMLLNPDINTGDIIYLDSKRVPQCNGTYYVTAIQHEGELRGNTWQTTINCSHTVNYTKGVNDEQKTAI